MKLEQRATRFQSAGNGLVGVVDVPERPLPRGVLLIPDGSQYRVGSHRQFALLSRMLAARGIPVMRFDRRGMGDSEGEALGGDEMNEDIRAALKEFSVHLPAMDEIVLLGLGDAGPAAAFYAALDERVRGLVLLNPQVRTPQAEALAELRHHYLARLGDAAFWKKVASGELDFTASAAALRKNLHQAAHERRAALPRRMVASLAHFSGQLLVVLGGADPCAREAARLLARHHVRCRQVEIVGADHSFSSRQWRDQVAGAAANWLLSW
jgi:exosortase A-associated hydrolase 1